MNTFERILKKYLDIFASQEMYFVGDTKNLELFEKHPSNTTADVVRMKVSAINDKELRLQLNPDDMVNHILKLNIDDRLAKSDLTLVEDIASLGGKEKHTILHFASAYCNFHKPQVYPIYSEQHFDFYRRYIVEYKLPVDVSKLNTYHVFCVALKDLVQRLGLTGKMNYLQLRKFGWLYAEKVVQESKAASEAV